MVEINERIVAEADDRGESLLVDEFLTLIEQYHSHDRPGIAWDTLEAYTDAMAGTDYGHGHDMEGVLDAVDERLTDDEYRVLPGVGAHAWLWTAPRDAYWSSLVRRW